jgi:hypothetical protein
VVPKKVWRKPELKTLKAGAAETASGKQTDSGGTKANHS